MKRGSFVGRPEPQGRQLLLIMASVVVAGSALVLALPAPAVGPAPVPASQAAGNPTLVLDTVRGVIEIELLRGDAPKSVDFIVALVEKNFYRGLRFHRAERGLVQVGDSASRDVTRKDWWGRSAPTSTIGVAEISKKLIHVRGIVGLAHTGNPQLAGSQFYIMKEASPSLNGKYTIIGRVRVGMPVVDTLKFADVLKQATIKEAAPK
ncbi:MAG: peptidylprolyl isomerase [Acidobacteria bacterium]|nr:peptidylprolyl isomerase [Acidobacteriota bacterium]